LGLAASVGWETAGLDGLSAGVRGVHSFPQENVLFLYSRIEAQIAHGPTGGVPGVQTKKHNLGHWEATTPVFLSRATNQPYREQMKVRSQAVRTLLLVPPLCRFSTAASAEAP